MNCLRTLVPQLTDKIEVFLLDDFHFGSPRLIDYCAKNGLNYVNTGIQKEGKPHWRVPGFALNIGAKLSTGNYLILGNAELYQMSKDTLEKMYIPDTITQPRIYDQPSIHTAIGAYKGFKLLCNQYPFFMGVPRKAFFDINGYDEDFIGYAWEDTDFSNRIFKTVDKFIEVDADIIHLWNPRGLRVRPDAPNLKNNAVNKINQKLYYERIDKMVRNEDKEWGVW